MNSFRVNEKMWVECRSERTRSGFRHVATLMGRDGRELGHAKVCYINRTWESWDFKTVLHNLLDKTTLLTEGQKTKVKAKWDREARGEVDQTFRTIGAVAALGGLFGTTPKEKNDWKERMIRAGLGDRGLSMPDDWGSLAEEEKGKRLDKVIEFCKADKTQ